MSVLGRGRDELLAVHIVKSCCLPILLYGCEIGRMSVSDKHEVDDVAWNKIVLEFFLNSCWRESAKPLLFFCNTMPASLLGIKRKFFFFLQKKTAYSRNTVLAAMSKVHYNDFQKLASTYSTSCLNASNTDIQMAI